MTSVIQFLNDLPSHNLPENPFGQLQLNTSPVIEQLPPLKQGLLLQGVTTIEKKENQILYIRKDEQILFKIKNYSIILIMTNCD